MTHGFIPLQCLDTVIVSIPKSKNVNLNDILNYQPIAVAIVISKLFKHFLKKFFLFFTTDNQFGYKPNHNIDMYILLSKQF